MWTTSHTIIVIAAILFFIALGFVIYSLWLDDHKNDDIPPVTNNCVKSTNNLNNITDVPNCILSSGRTGVYKIVKPPNINLHQGAVVSNIPVNYLQACRGYCTKGVGNNGKCIDGSNQPAYDTCISLTKPKDCTGPAEPVGFISSTGGIEFFYIYEAPPGPCQNNTNN